MEIFYCDRCGLRISDGDVQDGRAVDVGDGKLCPECAKAEPGAHAAAASSPASRPAPAKRESQRLGARARPASQRGSGGAPVRTGKSLAPVFVAFGAAFLAAMAVVLLVLKRPAKKPVPGGGARASRRETSGRPGAKRGGPAAASATEKTPTVPAASEKTPATPAAALATTSAKTPAGETPAAPDAGPAPEPSRSSLHDDFFAKLRKQSEQNLAKQELERAKLRELGKVVSQTGRKEPYEQDPGDDGLVRIETEEFSAKKKTDTHDWEFVEKPDGYTGRGAMRALPDSRAQIPDGLAERSPRLDYKINFVKTGTHYLWVRMFGKGHNGDSCHGGLDGDAVSSLRNITTNTVGRYYWEGTSWGDRVTFEIAAAGVHTINIWMREDGTVVDAILVTSNEGYRP
ncbi:MAG: hypothetical protein ACYSU0_08620 [Planctomycetota bacterium]